MSKEKLFHRKLVSLIAAYNDTNNITQKACSICFWLGAFILAYVLLNWRAYKSAEVRKNIHFISEIYAPAETIDNPFGRQANMHMI